MTLLVIYLELTLVRIVISYSLITLLLLFFSSLLLFTSITSPLLILNRPSNIYNRNSFNIYIGVLSINEYLMKLLNNTNIISNDID